MLLISVKAPGACFCPAPDNGYGEGTRNDPWESQTWPTFASYGEHANALSKVEGRRRAGTYAESSHVRDEDARKGRHLAGITLSDGKRPGLTITGLGY